MHSPKDTSVHVGDDVVLVSTANETKRLRKSRTKVQSRTWKLYCAICFLSLTVAISLAISGLALWKIRVLTDAVDELQKNCHRGYHAAERAKNSNSAHANTHGNQREGHDQEEVIWDIDVENTNDGTVEDESDYELYETGSGDPWLLGGNGDPEDDYDDLEDDDDLEETLIRGRREASGRGQRHQRGGNKGNGGGRNRGNRGGKKRRSNNKCEFKYDGRKKNAKLTGKEECLHGLKSLVQDEISKTLSHSAIHLEGNIEMTPQEQTQFKDDSNRYREMPHGNLYYQGYLPQNETLEFWRIPEWARNATLNPKMTETYDVIPGNQLDGEIREVRVKVAGLYFIYAQVTFHDTRAHMGFHVKKDPANQSEPRGVTLLSCLNGVDHINQSGNPIDTAKYKSCHASAVQYLRPGDAIRVESISNSLHVAARKTGFTYFGIKSL